MGRRRIWICEEHGFSNRRCCFRAVMLDELKEIMEDDKEVREPNGININVNAR